MFSLNRVQLIGYITQPVVLRQTPNSQSVADLNVATPYTFRAENGQALSGTGYHSVTAWGGMAENAAQYLRPGSQVYVSCRLQTDSWEDEQTGEKRSRTRFVALDLIFLDPRDGQIEVDSAGKAVSNCLNRADVIGNLTRDPEMRTTAGGQQLATFGVATNERWRDKTTGEQKERAEFHNVVVWGERAGACLTYLKKGRRVHVAGRVQTRSWEMQSGVKRTTTEIIAENVSLLGVKNTDIAYSSEPYAPQKSDRAPGKDAPARPSESSSSFAETGAGRSGEPEPEPEPVAAADIPEIRYESDVKAEDLPF